MENSSLPKWKLSKLKLIPKIEIPVLPDDFRPINLINTDHKMFLTFHVNE